MRMNDLRSALQMFSGARRVAILGFAVLAFLLFGSAVSVASAAPSNTVTATQSASSQMSMMRDTQTPAVLGICTSQAPNASIYQATGDNFSSCASCTQIGQLGEDNGLWENFWCWDLGGAGTTVELWVKQGPESS